MKIADVAVDYTIPVKKDGRLYFAFGYGRQSGSPRTTSFHRAIGLAM
jgi:hypothetical protein